MAYNGLTPAQDVDTLTAIIASLTMSDFVNPVTTRGYTGHEMVDDMGIIHMNGRIYHARIGRFLQADPFIQAATNTQSYNRYSYLLNNPLNATDPSGFFFKKLWNKIRPFVGAIISIVVAVACYGTCSAAAFALYSGIAGAVGGTGWQGFLGRGFVGGMQGVLSGGKFGSSFLAAGIGGAFGGGDPSVGGFIKAAVIGGVVSEMTGGKFANGAAGAAFMYAVSTGVKMIGAGGDPQDASTENRRGLCKSTGNCHPEDFSEAEQADIQKRLDPIRKATLGKHGSNKEALLAVHNSGLTELNDEYGIEFWAKIDPVSHEVYQIDTGYDMRYSIGANKLRNLGDIIYHTHPSGIGLYKHLDDFKSAHGAGASWIFAGSRNGMDGYMNLSYADGYRAGKFVPFSKKWYGAPYCSYNGSWQGGCL